LSNGNRKGGQNDQWGDLHSCAHSQRNRVRERRRGGGWGGPWKRGVKRPDVRKKEGLSVAKNAGSRSGRKVNSDVQEEGEKLGW